MGDQRNHESHSFRIQTDARGFGSAIAVLFMDLEDFKIINDSLVHEAGDALLTLVARRLKRCLRPEEPDPGAQEGGEPNEPVTVVPGR